MSTFGGVMEEFPDIRVDYFRQVRATQEKSAPPPALACFLSHVHTDHTVGLEAISFRGPFIYCSAATRELLLRLEKYPHRLNFARGVLEAQKAHFKHLKNILKPIPLETPTQIELSPGNVIQVTLFDANHCSGAVMFLFEGNGKAVLYTGDIRSEPWMVNNLSRNPLLIEYTSGLKTLDCIYLDTSNTSDIPFPTKAAGLKELLSKVAKYPSDIVFHFEAWTFGYEEVWIALSKALKSQIHVDTYKYKLYQSLRGTTNTVCSSDSGPFLTNESPILTGYTCGNTPQEGCLTTNTDVRIHSCEKGMHCSVLNDKTVLIRPIITKAHGEVIPEVGIGGGGGDLNQHPDLVLDEKVPIDDILSLFNDADKDVKDDVQKMLFAGLGPTGRSIPLDGMNLDRDETDLSLTQMAKIMAQAISKKRRDSQQTETFFHNGQEWPRVITFPYSRHSSYEELVDLVSAFRPKDVYPCTVNDNFWAKEGLSIAGLFGDECIANQFRHDREMDEKYPNRSQLASQHDQNTNSQLSQVETNSPERPTPREAVSEHQGAYRSISQDMQRTVELVRQSLPQSTFSIHTIRNAVLTAKGDDDKACDLLRGETNVVSAMKIIRGNNEGHLRPFDAAGNEISITPDHLDMETLPFGSHAATPGAESQSLRRKAIFDELGVDPKRVRLSNDGGSVPPHDTFNTQNEAPLNYESSQESTVNTPGSEADSDTFIEKTIPNMVFDADDQVHRCTLCSSEIWGGENGFCTGCEDGPEDMPYFESIEFNDIGKYRPGIAIDEHTDLELEGRQRFDVVGDYLEDDSSAYDTQDSDSNFSHEEYENNSFIDDSPSDAEEAAATDDSSLSDREDAFEGKYKALERSHTVLATKYQQLDSDYRELRHDFGMYSGDEDNEDDDDDERDEDGVTIVNVPQPQVVTTEVIVSSSEEQSDGEEISPDRIRLRTEVFEAVSGVSNRSWHDVSLASTTDNHTHAEVEL